MTIIHGFYFGSALCGKPGPAGGWPEEHQWVVKDDWGRVTCTDCLGRIKDGEGDALYKRFLGGGLYVRREGENYWLGHEEKNGMSQRQIRIRKETYQA